MDYLNEAVEFDTPAGVDVAVVAQQMGKTPTAEQVAAVVGARTPGPMSIMAYAGAAKTTTLRLLAGTMPHIPMVYLCFNKAIAEESSKVFPQNVKCATTHSMAYRAVLSRYGHNKTGKMTTGLRTRDVMDLLKVKDQPILNGTDRLDANTIAYAILRTVVRFTQSADLELGTQHFDRLPKFQTLEPTDFYATRERVVAAARILWDQMFDPASPVGLGHDGYVKAWHLIGATIDYPMILLDEGQDTAPVLLAILKEQSGQVIMVGDQHQSIYEWRGAINAMGALAGAREFRLTKSFRFGPPIADAANGVLSILGETIPLVGNESRESKVVAKTNGTVICRTNGEILSRLIDLAADNLANQSFVQGGVSEMLSILDGADAIRNRKKSWHSLFIGFTDWDEFCAYAEKSGDPEATKIIRLVDKYGIYPLKNALRQVREVEGDAKYVLTTGHKSKGREWANVTLADDFKEQPETNAEGEKVHNPAETRLFYVAMTRAMHELALPYWAHGAYGIPLPAGKEAPL